MTDRRLWAVMAVVVVAIWLVGAAIPVVALGLAAADPAEQGGQGGDRSCARRRLDLLVAVHVSQLEVEPQGAALDAADLLAVLLGHGEA